MIMTDLPGFAVRSAGFYFILLCLTAVLCALVSRGRPKTALCKIVSIPAAVLAFVPAAAIEEYSVRLNNLRPVSAWVNYTLSKPVLLFAVYAALITAALTFTVIRLIRLYRTTLTEQSVRDGLNHLPDGVCFSLPDGFPRLVNNRMQYISNSAFGSGVSDTLQLENRLKNNDFLPGCSTEKDNANTFLVLPDGNVFQLKQQEITAAGRPFREIIAYDVTERYGKIHELKKRNEHLASVNRQLRDYLGNIDRSVREKEILAAKISLHNRLGQCLLVLSSYLSGVENDRKTVTEQLHQTVELLKSNTPEEEGNDRLHALMKAAQAVGVEIKINGEIPARLKEVIEIALHECLTNTVKHAQGHLLEAEITETGGETAVTFTNDGLPPRGPVRETGGLANLRAAVLRQNGEMVIESEPVFRMTLRFHNLQTALQEKEI